MPDVFDDRDLAYRPRLQPLPDAWPAPEGRPILAQKGNSCTGHAVAAMVNAVLAAQGKKTPEGKLLQVSPYMLYRMARRYGVSPDRPNVPQRALLPSNEASSQGRGASSWGGPGGTCRLRQPLGGPERTCPAPWWTS